MAATSPLFVCVLLAVALGIQAKNCPSQYTLVENKCYYVSLTKHVADRSCRKLGGDLAVFNNEEDKNVATQYLKSLGLPFADSWRYSVWVGINCLGIRRNFRLSKTGDEVSYLNWVPREPNNASPEEDCVGFANYNNAFGYHDIECKVEFPFVCEARAADYYNVHDNVIF